MSQQNINVKIRNNPKFAELVGKRTRFAIILSLVVLAPYYTFMLLVSQQPQLFAAKISEGSVITASPSACKALPSALSGPGPPMAAVNCSCPCRARQISSTWVCAPPASPLVMTCIT